MFSKKSGNPTGERGVRKQARRFPTRIKRKPTEQHHAVCQALWKRLKDVLFTLLKQGNRAHSPFPRGNRFPYSALPVSISSYKILRVAPRQEAIKISWVGSGHRDQTTRPDAIHEV